MFWLNKREAEEFYEIYKRIYVESEYWVRLILLICPFYEKIRFCNYYV